MSHSLYPASRGPDAAMFVHAVTAGSLVLVVAWRAAVVLRARYLVRRAPGAQQNAICPRASAGTHVLVYIVPRTGRLTTRERTTLCTL